MARGKLRFEGAGGDLPFSELFDGAEPPAPDLPDGPVAVTPAYNEMLRLPDWFRHHRALGIVHFIMIDNGSTDGTSDFLDAQPDVTRLVTTQPWERVKRPVRLWPSDRWLTGRWVLHCDSDEFLIPPGWPDMSLPRLLAHWDRTGIDAAFAPMIDMYADGPAAEVEVSPGMNLLPAFPMFDAEGYWVAPPLRDRKAYPCPPYLLFGGPRERLFRELRGGGLLPAPMERLAIRAAMTPGRPSHPLPGARRLHKLIAGRTRPGVHSKVALMRWRHGTRFTSANHRISEAYKLAADWTPLLHFRLIPDFAQRQAEQSLRKSGEGAAEGARAFGEEVTRRNLVWSGSRRMSGWRDLYDTGLMRLSEGTRDALGL
ncbi:glycosyltransferase family 2 protein [Tropicimonas sp. IMCC34011]|uniref:glycosyltransferase family 2 protein n=1 Tax=Tropicimonas sp. IMCC34011 TaxID=2248759 RepID=UPI000E24550F|nr:glycosyltransferase family 2 protein [Tropicimonas sp. IMCC34011]